MQSPETTAEARRCLWVIMFLFVGWILLIVALVPAVLTLSIGTFTRYVLYVWAGLSLATHAVWFFAWGKDYRRLVVHCAYAIGYEDADPPDFMLLNAGSLPGFVLGILITG
ncbi:MAG: hypothetical protein ACRYFS_19775 [Janthinobacterium lividum]